MRAEAQIAEASERIAVSIAPILRTLDVQMVAMRPALETLAEQAQAFSESIQWATGIQSMRQTDLVPIGFVSSAVIASTSIDNAIQERPARKVRNIARPNAVIVVENARWDDIRIEFIDERSVQIFYKNRLLGTFDWQQLGFARQNTTDFRPDVSWNLLAYFAILAEHEDAKPTIDLLMNSLRLGRQTLEKRKHSLSMKLRAALGIADDPFHAYSVATGYRTVFSLKAPRGLRKDVFLHRSGRALWDADGSDDDEE